MIYSFKPIVTSKSKAIILGSMPGVTSLDEVEYYAYNRNQFWRIINCLFGDNELQSYEEKIKVISENELALWDTIKSCNRKNSADSNITDITPNNFRWLFKSYPKIKYIFFNGAKAEQVFRRYVKKELYKDKILTRLPSTSPANTQKFSHKLNKWKHIKEIIN